MSFLVVMIVDNIEDCPAILDAWEAAGVKGVTILESSGLGRYRQAGMRDDLPLIPSLRNLFSAEEVRHRTLLSVVDDQQMVDRLVEEAQRIIGNLDDPHTGFLFVVPVLQAYGLGRNSKKDR